MADNEVDLMQVQIGTQESFATAVTPTAKLMGASKVQLTPDIENAGVDEQRGTLTPDYTVVNNKVAASGKVPGTASYEQIGYFLDSLLGTATPVGAESPYTRTYLGPGAKPASKILTLVRGSSVAAYKIAGGIASEMSLKVETNKPVTYDCSFIGHSFSAATLESLSDIVANVIHANQMQLFIDAWDGTIGTTQFTPSIFSAELGLNMAKALKMGIGSANPTGYKQSKLAGGSNQLKLGLEMDTASKSYLDSIIASATSVPKFLVRMLFTQDTNHKLQIDYAGYAPSTEAFPNDSDGVCQTVLTLNPLYNTTLASWLKIVLTDTVAVLP
jgi:hypothetical protein